MTALQPLSLAELLRWLTTAGIGITQCALFGAGLRQMQRAAATRDKALDALIVAMPIVTGRTGGKATTPGAGSTPDVSEEDGKA
jgi:hypothetical protein